MFYLYTHDHYFEVFFHILIMKILSKKKNLGKFKNGLVAKTVYEIQLQTKQKGEGRHILQRVYNILLIFGRIWAKVLSLSRFYSAVGKIGDWEKKVGTGDTMFLGA